MKKALEADRSSFFGYFGYFGYFGRFGHTPGPAHVGPNRQRKHQCSPFAHSAPDACPAPMMDWTLCSASMRVVARPVAVL